jgi:putative flavoprotein involved in K+ transport
MTGIQPPERVETVVIGGGQAGLAVGYHLAGRGQRFTILEAAARVGTSWRNRWDGLRLFTPAMFDGLPGMAFPGPRYGLPSKDDVADYLEAYAARFRLPVLTGIRGDRLIRSETHDGWLVVTGHRPIEATQVVIATGAFARPKVPAFAGELDPEITQLHASEYRNPSQLRDGPVLVVGASNSGAEIAISASRDHPTLLSGRDTGKMPMRPESRLARIFDPPFWFFINHVVKAQSFIGRKVRPAVVDHGGPLERIWPEDLEAAGVERVFARTVGVRDGLPLLDGGRVVDVANVIWCTGFKPDFEWVQPSISGPDGWPVHVRGVVTGVSGLFVVGLPFLYSGASSLLGGVGRDAAYIADRIAARTATAPAPQARGSAAVAR